MVRTKPQLPNPTSYLLQSQEKGLVTMNTASSYVRTKIPIKFKILLSICHACAHLACWPCMFLHVAQVAIRDIFCIPQEQLTVSMATRPLSLEIE